MNRIDLTAKLLANENINVVKAAVRTASFNIETRLLKLPILKDVTKDIEDMLVSHEIGHALFTTHEMVEASRDNRRLHGYLNVVEDARIEKLVKRKYPGTKKTFSEGYKQLNERDFFQLSKIKDLNNLKLIDRINLYFKLGKLVTIQFNEEEQVFVDRVAKTETPLDVIKLSKELFEYAKEQKKQEKENQEQNKPKKGEDEQEAEDSEETEPTEDSDNSEELVESEDDDSDDSEELVESGDDDSDDDTDGSGELDDDDDDLEPITDDAFKESLDGIVDCSTEYQYHTLDYNFVDNIVTGYKTILTELSEGATDIYYQRSGRNYSEMDVETEYKKFKEGALKSVGYLVKEFEMKKAATAYKRSSVAKSGSLDMKKIWGYQLNEDLFKRVTTVTDGKNHGMVFLLDWSGSMAPVIHDAIEQVITLSMFCQRAQIPYQVFAFTDSYNNSINPNKRNWIETAHNVFDNAVSNCTLLELFSHKMTNTEFNAMSKLIFNTGNITQGKYRLGSTPLNQALSYMTDYIGKFTRKNNVEKVSFITLTDGQGSQLESSMRYNNSYVYRRCTHFLTDTATKKVYPHSDSSTEQTSTLLKIIKDRWDATTIAFYISSGTKPGDFKTAMYYNGAVGNMNDNCFIDKTRSEALANGFAKLDAEGRDSLFIIPSKSLKIKDEDLVVNSKSSAKVIANKFTKNLASQQINRLLLNNFVKLIA